MAVKKSTKIVTLAGLLLSVALFNLGFSSPLYRSWHYACAKIDLTLGFRMWGCGNWPMEPVDEAHPIGNSGGEFQYYPGYWGPYFHTGIDIVVDNPAPSGPYVLTKDTGKVDNVTYPGPDCPSNESGLQLSFGGPNNGTTQVYAHLNCPVTDPVRTAFVNRTDLPAGTEVAQVIEWPECDYHHLHFETWDMSGAVEPVLKLFPRHDKDFPVVENISFTQNGSTIEDFPPPVVTVKGKVDIVAQAYDRQFVTPTQNHKTGVLKIRYQVSDATTGNVVKTGKTIDFSTIADSSKTTVLFRTAGDFVSSSDYCGDERYYYVVTNVDDNNPANFAEEFAWDTTKHRDGDYRVEVRAWDASSNAGLKAKRVKIRNN